LDFWFENEPSGNLVFTRQLRKWTYWLKFKKPGFQGFIEIDDRMHHEESLKDDMSGSTAIVAFLRDHKVGTRAFSETGGPFLTSPLGELHSQG
jgi:hypothetical protein